MRIFSNDSNEESGKRERSQSHRDFITMFESLSNKLETTFKQLRNRGKLTESDIDLSLKDIRNALLEADVNLNVVKEFCENVKQKALGMKVLKSLNPGQMVIKYVHEELIAAMGEHSELKLKFAPPVIIMLVGLQGSGKTTSCAKLARFLKQTHKKRPLLVPADVYRPAAIEQLKTLGKSLDIDVFDSNTTQQPLEIAKQAADIAKKSGYDIMILDTAGRLQIDQKLMNELADIVEAIEPHEILLVADAMTGQEAANVASGFDSVLDIDGVILTKLDGDARGGAALSIRKVTNKPIKLIGVGEKTDALEPFYPDRMASRILGMGDILTLIDKATQEIDLEDAKSLQKKIKKNEFSLEDFLSQLQTIKRMGSMSSLMKMIPGAAQAMKGVEEGAPEKELKRIEAMIFSMTPEERRDTNVLNGSRRKRIAQGSGTSVEELNKMLQQFDMMRKMMKKFSGAGGKDMLRGMGGLFR